MRACGVCGGEVVGRSDKKHCSAVCKQQAKRAYDVARYPDIRDAAVARACEWQAQNRERKQQYDAAYRRAMSEDKREAKRAYDRRASAERPELGVYRQQRRRVRKRANGVYAVTARDYARLLAAHGGRCAYCRTEFTTDNRLEWDHVVPVARGGTHSVGNLAPACLSCNRGKSLRFVSEWRAGKVVAKPSLVSAL